MSAPVELSLVVPVYNERESLRMLVAEVDRALAGRRYEIVAVDDGSSDGSLDELKALKRDHPELHIVALAANAGQTAAFAAGFRVARGRVIVTLDADLQNDPADIPALVAELAKSGATAVAGYRVDRRDSGWKRLQSRVANRVRNRLNRETIRDTGCSLKAFRADALRELALFNGMHRFLPTLIRLQGGSVREVPVRHRPRRYGKTKYGMWNRVFRGPASAPGRWRSPSCWPSSGGRPRGGWRTGAGGDRVRARSRRRVRLSWRSSLPFAAAALLAALQAPNYRVTYRLRVLQPAAGAGAGGGADTQLLAGRGVTGPPETNLRRSLRTPAAELRGLPRTPP